MISSTKTNGNGALNLDRIVNNDMARYQTTDPDKFSESRSTQHLKILGLIHLISSITNIISYSFMYGTLHVQKGLLENPGNNFEIHGKGLNFLKKILQKFIVVDQAEGYLVLHMPEWFSRAYYYAFHKETFYFFVLFIISFLGLFFNPLWFALSLVEFLRVFKDMLYVTLVRIQK